MLYGFPKLSALEALNTYAATAKPDQYKLGDTYMVNHHGMRAILRLMKAGVALAQGNVLTYGNIKLTRYLSESSNTYTAKVDEAHPATIKMGAAVIDSSANLAKDELAGLSAAILTGTGQGQFAQIVGNNAAIASTDYLTLNLSRNLVTAISSTDDVLVIPDLVAAKTAALTDVITGVVFGPTAVAAGEYFWACVGGYCFTLVSEQTTVRDTNIEMIQLVGSATSGVAQIATASSGDTYEDSIPFGVLISKTDTTASHLALSYIYPRFII
jgi:hypothetical protein